MGKEDEKISTWINDPIHKNVGLYEHEVLVVDHAAFQRLRRVKALGFLDRVFPSAKHSRFEHSIGACHVASLIFDSIKDISTQYCGSAQWAESSEHLALSSDEAAEVFSPLMRKCVRVAALLHDVGHGPFSHASESIMPPIDDLIDANPGASKFIRAALEKSRSDKQRKGKTSADHEDYSLLVMERILQDVDFPSEEIHLIAALKSSLVEPPQEHDKGTITLLSQLVDGEIDSDRMDYLLRDSYFCGVPYGNYDLKRLQEGLCIVKERKSGKKSFAILRKAITAFEDFLFSRFQMHVQVYTHKIDASCNKAFEELAKQSGFTLPASIDEYIEIDDENFLDRDKNLKANLGEMIRNRKLWPMALQSYSNDRSNETALFEKFTNSLGKANIAIYNSERPFKKQSLLDFPVVAKAIGDVFMSEKMRKSSELVAHYNAVFGVRRLFYRPDHTSHAKAVLESITEVVTLDATTLASKRAFAEKASSSLSSKPKKDERGKKKG